MAVKRNWRRNLRDLKAIKPNHAFIAMNKFFVLMLVWLRAKGFVERERTEKMFVRIE